MNFVMAGTPLSRSVCSGTIGTDFSRVWQILIIQKMDHRAQKWLVPNFISWKRRFFIFGRFCKTRTLRIPSLFGFAENLVRSDHSGHYDEISKELKKMIISRFLVFEWFFCNQNVLKVFSSENAAKWCTTSNTKNLDFSHFLKKVGYP